MYWSMIRKSLMKNKIQKLLVLLTCFLSTLLICAMFNIALGIGNGISKELRSYGSNIVILPQGSNFSIEVGHQIYEPLKSKNFLDENDLHLIKEIFWRNNIVAFSPFLEGEVVLGSKKVLLNGVYFHKHIIVEDEDDFFTGVKDLYPFLKVQGEWIEDDVLDEVLIGEALAHSLNLQPRQILILNGREVKVRGIISGEKKFDNKVVTSLKFAQNIFNQPQRYSRAEVSALTIPENALSHKARKSIDALNQLEYDQWYCSAFVSTMAFQIEEAIPQASARAQTSISDAESLIVKKIQSLMFLSVVICLVVGSIAIACLMNSEIYRRQGEIGLLKVLGANAFRIYTLFVGENLIVAFLSSLLGFFVGIGISEWIAMNIFSYFIEVSWIVLPIGVIFSTLIVSLGCLFGIKGIVKLSPAEVLYDR